MLVQLLEELAGWLSLRECLAGVLVTEELADDELLYLPAAEYERLLYSNDNKHYYSTQPDMSMSLVHIVMVKNNVISTMNTLEKFVQHSNGQCVG